MLITGSRSIRDKEWVWWVLKEELRADRGDTAITGGADGVDTLTIQFCEEHNIPCEVVRPINFRAASYLYRNTEMIGKADRTVALWDGKSRGTKFTMDYAKKRHQLNTYEYKHGGMNG